MRVQSYLLPWLLSYTAVQCAPTGSDAPGIGVELEVRKFKLQNKGEAAMNTRKDEDIAKVKGAVLLPVGLPKEQASITCGEYWDLTAEHGGREPESGISDLTWEWIINGQTLKLKKSNKAEDDLVLPGVFREIREKLKKLNPKKGDKFGIFNMPFEPWGLWTLEEPPTYEEASTFPGIQVTAPLPMEAIQELISIIVNNEDVNGNEGVKRTFVPTVSAKTSNIVLVYQQDLVDVYEGTEDITTDMLGFYSLLMSYVKIATTMTDADRANGPKQKLSIMPRTDWKTMYNMYAKEDDNTRKTKCRPKKKNPNQSLLDIVKDLAKKKQLSGDIESATFKWDKAKAPAREAGTRGVCSNMAGAVSARALARRGRADTSANWPTKAKDQADKSLSLKSWLEGLDKNMDPLSAMDELVWDGQIGGLGDRLEAPLYPEAAVDDSKYPLFELRDLTGGGMDKVEGYLKEVEVQIKKWHQNPPEIKANKLRKRAKAGACKKPSNGDGEKCTGNSALNAQKKCETCAKGTKPNVGNTACVPDVPEDDKEKGKCKDDGYILDPAQGGQDKNTENPVCTLDDSKKCEDPSQTAVTRSPKNKVEPKDAAAYQAECAKDDDKNFRCKDPKKTYHHKEIDNSGDEKKIKHSCRATRNTKKEQADKYKKRVETAKEEKKKTTGDKQTEKKESSRRGRNGMCWSLLVGLGAWDLAEIEGMSPDEVDGMLELWPENDQEPKYLEDHMVTIGKKSGTVVGGIEQETAGIGLPIVYVVKGIIKLFKIFGKGSRAAPAPAKKDFYTDIKNAGSRPKAPSKSIDAAKNSGTVAKILKDKRFLDCLAVAPAAAKMVKRDDPPNFFDVNDLRVKIDWNAKDNGFKIPDWKYEDRQITVRLGVDTDNIFKEGGAKDWASTYPDRINRPGRLEYENCQVIPDEFKNKVTAVETWGGCCAYYKDNDCKNSSFMFTMTDREDWKLKGDHNDNMEALWCTFETNCKGAPGAPA
ncbi:hypothetical protein DE146DRAFT_756900 [Phaeosphaeria sp. MPI-PUGE-AT-0046c]|nr:hypothetical protein DE146DRAFT_756900 [Phaeosphaeria sp. MPI-PUGE-AT-0046c]